MTADDEFAEVVRRALHEEAEQVRPAGDGLIRIRQQVAQRRRRRSWTRPLVAMAAAAGVAAAAVATPAIVRQLGPAARPASVDGLVTAASGPAPRGLGSSQPTPAAAAPAQPTFPKRTPAAPRRTLPPGSGVVDMRTLWPYVSRAEGYYSADADVAAGRHPELTDAARTAVAFVQRYVGPRVTLTAGASGAKDRGVGVVVNRTLSDGSSHPVTRVYLVQVSAAQQSPYVVAGAERPALAEDTATLTVMPPAAPVRPGDDHITVSGTVQRPGADAAPPVHVEVGDASGSEVSFNRAVSEPVSEPGSDPGSYLWTASISLQPGDVDRAVTVAAWTLDDDAGVLEFVATPVPLQSDPATGTSPASPVPSPSSMQSE